MPEQSTGIEPDAAAIGVEAYLYFYPLVTMDLTRRQLRNVVKADGLHAPMNAFANFPAFPTADMKVVVRPNFDTLYSSAWLDLTGEPMIVSVPDTHGRYYLLPMLDMWTDVFASPGWRTTGTSAADFAVLPPGFAGALPAGVARIGAPTPHVWVVGRTKTDGPPDYEAVHAIQAGFKITPLSQWGKPAQAAVGRVDPAVDMKTPPKAAVDSMPAGKFFAYAADILTVQPPHVTDQPILARMRRIGIEPGKGFDIDRIDPAIRRALENAPEEAQKLMAWKVKGLAQVVNGWSMNTDTMGVYGNYYLKRAIIAQMGLGANLPEDAIYALNLADDAGKPLDGANDYVLRFEKEAAPPAGKGRWSDPPRKARGARRNGAARGGLSGQHSRPRRPRPQGATFDAVLPQDVSAAIAAALTGVVTSGNHLVGDGGKPLAAFARKAKIPFHAVPSPGKPSSEAPHLHIDNVNAYHSRLKRWLTRFNGVATKNLPSYLGWRRALEAWGQQLDPPQWIKRAIGNGPYQQITL